MTAAVAGIARAVACACRSCKTRLQNSQPFTILVARTHSHTELYTARQPLARYRKYTAMRILRSTDQPLFLLKIKLKLFAWLCDAPLPSAAPRRQVATSSRQTCMDNGRLSPTLRMK